MEFLLLYLVVFRAYTVVVSIVRAVMVGYRVKRASDARMVVLEMRLKIRPDPLISIELYVVRDGAVCQF